MRIVQRLRMMCLALLVAIFATCPVCRAGDEAKNQALSAEDRKLLDGLIQQFLFDPRGAQRVLVKAVERSVWTRKEDVERPAWLVPGKEGKPARVYFIDQAAFPAPDEKGIKKVDFVTAYKARPAKAEAPA